MSEHPEDVCTCGDYRRQHVGGTGHCIFNHYDRGHGMGLRACHRFKLYQAATPSTEGRKGEDRADG